MGYGTRTIGNPLTTVKSLTDDLDEFDQRTRPLVARKITGDVDPTLNCNEAKNERESQKETKPKAPQTEAVHKRQNPSM